MRLEQYLAQETFPTSAMLWMKMKSLEMRTIEILKVCIINYDHISSALIGWLLLWIILIIIYKLFCFVLFYWLITLIFRLYKHERKFERI